MRSRLIFFLLIVLTSCSDSREYNVKFDHVDRLDAGDKIFIRGVHVGQVEKLTVDEDNKILVSISIIKDIEVTEGSKFILQSDVFGVQHIEIELADANNKLIEVGQLHWGEIKPMDTTGFRKITQAEYDSIIEANPGAKLIDSILQVLRTVYKDKKKSGE